jgi:hypothetical protein
MIKKSALFSLSLLVTALSFSPSLLAANVCESYQGSWVYQGREADGFDQLQMTLDCDAQAPLPSEYVEWARGKEMPLRGWLTFNVDGYKMGPFPYAAVVGAKSVDGTLPRLNTHYFYTYAGEDGYEYEDFDLLMSPEGLNLWDMEECDTGFCEVQYPFKQLR